MGKGVDVLPAHGDITCFTILSHDLDQSAAGARCLEILDTEQKCWRTVEAMPNTFLVNIGQIMERWSGGRFKATMHRVASPADAPPGSNRQSLVFFQVTNHDVELRPHCDLQVPVE